MKTVLIILLIVFMVLVVVALVRGVIAFLQSTKIDLENGDDGVKRMQLQQNRMMMSRIKYQALAIVVVAVLLVLAR